MGQSEAIQLFETIRQNTKIRRFPLISSFSDETAGFGFGPDDVLWPLSTSTLL